MQKHEWEAEIGKMFIVTYSSDAFIIRHQFFNKNERDVLSSIVNTRRVFFFLDFSSRPHSHWL